MKSYKSDNITIRVNPLLKDKFSVAVVFSSLTEVLNNFIVNYVRDYEKIYGVIPVNASGNEKYRVITEMYGMKISKETFSTLEGLYPISKNPKSLHKFNKK